jgi:hypothetical protein
MARGPQSLTSDKTALPGRPDTPAKIYLVTREDGFTGRDKYVEFWKGEGVLDLYAIHLERPDWVINEGGKYVQVTGESLDAYVGYWERRGIAVKEITLKEAASFRTNLVEEKRKAELVILARAKARTKAKTIDQESKQQEMEIAAEAKAKQELGMETDATGEAPAPDPAGQTPDGGPIPMPEPLPHEVPATDPKPPAEADPKG